MAENGRPLLDSVNPPSERIEAVYKALQTVDRRTIDTRNEVSYLRGDVAMYKQEQRSALRKLDERLDGLTDTVLGLSQVQTRAAERDYDLARAMRTGGAAGAGGGAIIAGLVALWPYLVQLLGG